MILIEFDLAGAEWVVVAYLAGDQNMMGVVESGRSPHVVTGSLISGASEDFVLADHKVVGGNTDPDTIRTLRSTLAVPPGIFLPRSMSIRQAGKKSNHGCNYYMRYKRFALENEMPEADAEPIVEYYSTKAYPGLQNYWEMTRETMKGNGRVLTNCFGRKIRLLGEWGIELWMAAYAFVPQSTVFDVCMQGMISAYNDDSLNFYDLHMGAQVHDSLMGVYPLPTDKDGWYRLGEMCTRMVHQHMRHDLIYKGATDGVERTFVLGVDAKIGYNWGDMRSVKITLDIAETIDNLKNALQQEVAAVVESEWQATSLLSPELPSG